MLYNDSTESENQSKNLYRKGYCRVCRREARRRHPWRGLWGGLILILIGTLFLLKRGGWLPDDNLGASLVIGLGAILIISGLVQYRNREYHCHGYGRLIAGLLLIAAGVLGFIGWSQWWPVLLIAGGVSILLCVLFRRERNETI